MFIFYRDFIEILLINLILLNISTENLCFFKDIYPVFALFHKTIKQFFN